MYAVIEKNRLEISVAEFYTMGRYKKGPFLSREEKYEIVFDTDGGTYSYITSDPAEFAMFRPGSRWGLKVNRLGAVVSVEPR